MRIYMANTHIESGPTGGIAEQLSILAREKPDSSILVIRGAPFMLTRLISMSLCSSQLLTALT